MNSIAILAIMTISLSYASLSAQPNGEQSDYQYQQESMSQGQYGSQFGSHGQGMSQGQYGSNQHYHPQLNEPNINPRSESGLSQPNPGHHF